LNYIFLFSLSGVFIFVLPAMEIEECWQLKKVKTKTFAGLFNYAFVCVQLSASPTLKPHTNKSK